MASYLARWTTAKNHFETEAGKKVGKTKLAKPSATGIFWIRKSSGMEKVCKLLDDTAKTTPEKAKAAIEKFEAQSNEYKKLLIESAANDANYKQVKKQLGDLMQAIDSISSDFREVWITLAQKEAGNTALAEVSKISKEFAVACTEMRTIRTSFEKLGAETARATNELEQALDQVQSLAPSEKSNASQWKRYRREIETILASLEKSEAMINQINKSHDTATQKYREARGITLFQSAKPHKQKSADAQKQCEQILETMTKVLTRADDDHLYAFHCGQDGEHFRAMAEEANARIAALEKEQERLANRKQNRGKTRLA